MGMNEDLVNERSKCTFNKNEITNIIDGGPEKTEHRRKLYDFFLSDKTLFSGIPDVYLSHQEVYEESIRKSCVLLKKINDWNDISDSTAAVDVYSSVMGGMLGSSIMPGGMPLGLHYVMFIPALLGQATLEQQAFWIPRAWTHEIIGTYAQTELGHGTFLRGLETTAHYDASTEEFIIHSPSITAYKWWPGGLGQTANYAVVMAQLFIKGKSCGIQPFIVQLREEGTHLPMPGIIIGDIGAKLGMNATNNGYLGFKKVRIPRTNMLMKHTQVLPDGTVVKGASEKLTYGTMIFVRVSLIKGVSCSYLMKAVTIAVRYSMVRRQGMLTQGSREVQIIDYRTQQWKLFPHISSVMAMIFSSKWLWDMYNNVTSEMEEGDLDRLPELHAMACCLKAVCSTDAAQGIEECRKSCGGHGYMCSSGFPSAYSSATAAETYEGENTVMYLQTARFLMKMIAHAKGGEKMPGTCKYMENHSFEKDLWINDSRSCVDAFNQVAAGMANECFRSLKRLTESGKSQEVAWNETSNILVKCAEAHCRAFMVKIFYESVQAAPVSPGTRDVLNNLFNLYSVYLILKNLGSFLMYSNVKVGDVEGIEEWREDLLTYLRPNAVSIVDAFEIPDEVLSSALGAYDGDVYNRIFKEANRSPLNHSPVNKSFQKYLKPFLNSSL